MAEGALEKGTQGKAGKMGGQRNGEVVDRGIRGDPGRTLLTVLVVAVVGQWHGVHRAGETWHGRGRWPGARGMQLAEFASEVRGTEAAVRLHAHTAVVTDQGTQDCGEREANSVPNVVT